MAAIAQAKEVGVGFNNRPTYIRTTYDFDVDGGDVGALDVLTAKNNIIISRVVARVVSAGDSGNDLAEVSLGKTGSATAFINGASTGLVTALTDDKVIVATSPGKLAAGDKVILTIGEEALTAGKIDFIFEIYQA